jgi:ADP-heptose:LPS heptosyltransferase
VKLPAPEFIRKRIGPSTSLGRSLRRLIARSLVCSTPRPTTHFDRGDLAAKRVAFVKLDAIGDLILATTFLQVARAHLPPQNVTLFCRKPASDLAKAQFPEWNIVELPSQAQPFKTTFFRLQTRRLIASQGRFNLLVDLRALRGMVESVITSWIRADFKVAIRNQNTCPETRLPLEERLFDLLLPSPYAAEPGTCQDIRNHRSLVRFLFPGQVGTEMLFPKLTVNQSAFQKVSEMLKRECGFGPGGRFLLVCPGSLMPLKEYPVEKLARAVQEATSDWPAPVIIAGGPGDLRIANQLAAHLATPGLVLNWAGKLALNDHVALVASASAVLTMDSSTAHIAGALNQPAVVILGGGQPGFFGPWGNAERFRWLQHPVPCFGCNWNCVHERPLCVQEIEPIQIAKHLRALVPVG